MLGLSDYRRPGRRAGILVVVLASAVGCGGDPVAPDTTARLAGTYTLTRFRGAQMPYAYPLELDGRGSSLVSRSYTLARDGTAVFAESWTGSVVGRPDIPVGYEGQARWEALGDTAVRVTGALGSIFSAQLRVVARDTLVIGPDAAEVYVRARP